MSLFAPRRKRRGFAVLGRKVTKGGDVIEWWISTSRRENPAAELCSRLNEEAMFDSSGWYYIICRRDAIDEFMSLISLREKRNNK